MYSRQEASILRKKFWTSFGQYLRPLPNADGEMIPAFRFSQHTTNLPGFEALIDIHPHPLDWLHWENSFSYVRGRFTEPVGETTNVPFIPAAKMLSAIIFVWLTCCVGLTSTKLPSSFLSPSITPTSWLKLLTTK